jgi:hypothetical protein
MALPAGRNLGFNNKQKRPTINTPCQLAEILASTKKGRQFTRRCQLAEILASTQKRPSSNLDF